ncbi:hypothetical protein ACFFIX_20415 [Metabacillus herbersteinensis]|uniref:Uncharacterized protein n=1 Tax=Metabacillus herbersteinensis TaxID=283816 RepID=A0ABV6GJ96_9BACI
MNFDLSKFEKNLKERDKNQKPSDQCGIANVVRHIWDHDPISSINFDSFSISDAKYALEAMEVIELGDIGEEETFLCDPKNPFVIHREIESVVYGLFHSKNKIYTSDEVEFFI